MQPYLCILSRHEILRFVINLRANSLYLNNNLVKGFPNSSYDKCYPHCDLGPQDLKHVLFVYPGLLALRHHFLHRLFTSNTISNVRQAINFEYNPATVTDDSRRYMFFKSFISL